MSQSPEQRGGWTLRALPGLVVLVVAAWLLWPVPAGRMPLSADHTVHLTRIVLTAQRLAEQGSLSGWEPTWFFGFPLGELYPQLGDLLIIAVHGLGLGMLDWPQAYALGFFLVFALQGLVLIRVGRLFGFGVWPGLIAALLMLADPGFTREGGWMYTVYFGVWPQALATSLGWLGLAELARALGWQPTQRLVEPLEQEKQSDKDDAHHREIRAMIWAGLSSGAALLAHPIALPMLGIGGLLVLITLVPRGPTPWRAALARCLIAGLIAGCLAAWWWVPMLQNRAWMASYGWLFMPLEAMLKWASEGGALAQRMPAAVGYLAIVGLVLASVGAGRVARFVALFALLQWLLASSDVFWALRLDHFSPGFSHIQYQRFLIGAKPGLFLCAGLAVVVPLSWARRLVLTRGVGSRGALKIAAALPLAALSCGAGLWLLADSQSAITEHGVGSVQVERVPGSPDFDADYRAFTSWAREQWEGREADYRLAVRAPRNSHWFMDAPVWTATPQYKLGFTPGDNFVHKPESGHRQVLDALGVRWMVARERANSRPRPTEVARFGTIVVSEQRGQPWPLVHLQDQQGEHLPPEQAPVELLEVDLRGGLVRARVSPAQAGQRVVFAIAGYPRWQLRADGQPLEWFEVPLYGAATPVSQEQRAAGLLRGGKARGDDGSEPTLIAATLPDRPGPIELELRYQRGGVLETGAKLLSLLTLILSMLAVLALPNRPLRGWPVRLRGLLARAEVGLARALHPLVLALLAALGLTLLGLRWRGAAQAEASTLLGWVEAGAARGGRVEAGPVKTDMLIRPAVLLRPRPGQPAQLELRVEALPAQLSGWLGLDDDQAQQPGRWAQHALRIEVRPLVDRPLDDRQPDADPEGGWSTLLRMSVAHEPQLQPFVLETGELAGRPVQLRIIDETRGKRLARLGLNLELGAPP